jgi:transposase
MLTVLTKEAIRQLYFDPKRPSIRELARQTGHSYRTIKAATRDPAPSSYRRTRQRPRRVLAAFVPIIEEWLTTDSKRPRKQRHTAKRVWMRLRGECGFTGGASTVRDFVRGWKRAHGIGLPEVTVLIEHPPGVEAQVDWGGVAWICDGVEVEEHLFVMSLPHSTAPFLQVYPFERQEAFFDGHVRAFDFFGGVPHRIRYDNLATAVLKILRGRARREQNAFIHLRSHYLFESGFCTPRKGNEKGSVEGRVGYGRRNFFVPLPAFGTRLELNAWLLARCREEWARIPEGRAISIGQALEEERKRMRPLPRIAFDPGRAVLARANQHAQVRFDGSSYSVPENFALRPVTVRGYVERVVLSVGERPVATHRRSEVQGAVVEDPAHYFALLKKKPALLDHARVFRNWQLPEPLVRYRQAVREACAGEAGNREAEDQALRSTARVLSLAGRHRLEDVVAAVEAALREGRLEPEAIACRVETQPQAARAGVATCPRLGIPPVNLAAYQDLLSPRSTPALVAPEPAADHLVART